VEVIHLARNAHCNGDAKKAAAFIKKTAISKRKWKRQ
jgi:hypothetical protein